MVTGTCWLATAVPALLSAMVIVVVSVPAGLLATFGVTVRVTLAPAASVPLAGDTGAKLAPLPLSFATQGKGALPVLVRVTVCACGLLPTYVLKVSGVVGMLITGAGGGVTVNVTAICSLCVPSLIVKMP